MRKYVFALILVLVMAVPAFAQIVNTATGLAATIKDNNQNQNTNLFTPVNVFTPVNANSNIQGQQQGQIQGQEMNNKQNIAPVQEVNIKSPAPLLNTPSQSVPELNFGTGRMKDVTYTIPNFAIYGIKKYAGEFILDVMNVNANVKFKNYYKAVLSDAKDLASAKGFKSAEVRIQVICAEAQKTWTSGGNLGGAGSALSSSGLSGASGGASIIPQFGGTKADDLFTIIFVKVAL